MVGPNEAGTPPKRNKKGIIKYLPYLNLAKWPWCRSHIGSGGWLDVAGHQDSRYGFWLANCEFGCDNTAHRHEGFVSNLIGNLLWSALPNMSLFLNHGRASQKMEGAFLEVEQGLVYISTSAKLNSILRLACSYGQDGNLLHSEINEVMKDSFWTWGMNFLPKRLTTLLLS